MVVRFYDPLKTTLVAGLGSIPRGPRTNWGLPLVLPQAHRYSPQRTGPLITYPVTSLRQTITAAKRNFFSTAAIA